MHIWLAMGKGQTHLAGNAPLAKCGENPPRAVFSAGFPGIEQNIGGFGRFIWAAQAGEIWNEPSLRLGVEPFGITRHAGFNRRINMNFKEILSTDQFTQHLPIRPKRGDEGSEHNQPRIHHQLRHFAGTADIFNAIRSGEAKISAMPPGRE